MKSMNAWRLSSVAGIGLLICAPSIAAENRYGYVGFGLGQSWSNIDASGVAQKLSPGGGPIIRDEQDFAFKVFGGYQFNRYLALEGGYFNLGEFGFKSTVVPAGTLRGSIALQGINLDVVGTLPLSDRWALLSRVGAQYADTNDRFLGTGSVVVLNSNPTKKEVNYKAGVGVQYAFSRAVLLRLEGERFRVNDALSNHGDVNMLSLSLVLPLRAAPPPAPMPVAEPAYVAPPPQAPAPVVAPPPPPQPPVIIPPPRRRVSFSADSLFGFDKSTIRPEGKAELDVFAQDLKGTRFEVITVEGHTDRLGSSAYNEKLSVERAETVKAYLVNSGVDGTKITTVGKGETTPITKPEDCKGEKRSPKLIACLQPDRRVEVEVVGTQRAR